MCAGRRRETYLTDEKNELAFTRIEQAALFSDMTHEREKAVNEREGEIEDERRK